MYWLCNFVLVLNNITNKVLIHWWNTIWRKNIDGQRNRVSAVLWWQMLMVVFVGWLCNLMHLSFWKFLFIRSLYIYILNTLLLFCRWIMMISMKNFWKHKLKRYRFFFKEGWRDIDVYLYVYIFKYVNCDQR